MIYRPNTSRADTPASSRRLRPRSPGSPARNIAPCQSIHPRRAPHASLLTALVLCLLHLTACANTPSPSAAPQSAPPPRIKPTTTPGLEQLDAIILRGIADKLYPGAVCIVGQVDPHDQTHQILYAQAFGFTTYQPEHPNDDDYYPVALDTLYDLASLTKVVATTTATLLNLADGQLALDDTAHQYLPGFEQRGKDSITLRHLLTHTSGLKPYESFTLVEADRHENESHSDALLRHYAALPLAYPTGEGYAYSCLNFQTLARINEIAADESQEALLIRRVFDPLGMHDTRYTLNEAQRFRAAPTFRDRAGRPVVATTHDPLARYHGTAEHCPGNAGLFSTAPDLARFAQLILSQGKYNHQQRLDPELLAQATAPQTNPHTVGERRGLGFDVYESTHYITDHNTQPGHELVGHTGYTGTMMLLDQHTGRYLILLTNRTYPADPSATDQAPSINTVRRACWQVVR